MQATSYVGFCHHILVYFDDHFCFSRPPAAILVLVPLNYSIKPRLQRLPLVADLDRLDQVRVLGDLLPSFKLWPRIRVALVLYKAGQRLFHLFEFFFFFAFFHFILGLRKLNLQVDFVRQDLLKLLHAIFHEVLDGRRDFLFLLEKADRVVFGILRVQIVAQAGLLRLFLGLSVQLRLLVAHGLVELPNDVCQRVLVHVHDLVDEQEHLPVHQFFGVRFYLNLRVVGLWLRLLRLVNLPVAHTVHILLPVFVTNLTETGRSGSLDMMQLLVLMLKHAPFKLLHDAHIAKFAKVFYSTFLLLTGISVRGDFGTVHLVHFRLLLALKLCQPFVQMRLSLIVEHFLAPRLVFVDVHNLTVHWIATFHDEIADLVRVILMLALDASLFGFVWRDGWRRRWIFLVKHNLPGNVRFVVVVATDEAFQCFGDIFLALNGSLERV